MSFVWRDALTCSNYILWWSSGTISYYLTLANMGTLISNIVHSVFLLDFIFTTHFRNYFYIINSEKWKKKVGEKEKNSWKMLYINNKYVIAMKNKIFIYPENSANQTAQVKKYKFFQLKKNMLPNSTSCKIRNFPTEK